MHIELPESPHASAVNDCLRQTFIPNEPTERRCFKAQCLFVNPHSSSRTEGMYRPTLRLAHRCRRNQALRMTNMRSHSRDQALHGMREVGRVKLNGVDT
jgi:hypothetical protein